MFSDCTHMRCEDLNRSITWVNQRYLLHWEQPNTARLTGHAGHCVLHEHQTESSIPVRVVDYIILISSSNFRCLSSACPLTAHIICLAREILKKDTPGTLLPLEGYCPSCCIPLLWGDLVRLKQGCYQQREPEGKDEDWLDILSQEVWSAR